MISIGLNVTPKKQTSNNWKNSDNVITPNTIAAFVYHFCKNPNWISFMQSKKYALKVRIISDAQR